MNLIIRIVVLLFLCLVLLGFDFPEEPNISIGEVETLAFKDRLIISELGSILEKYEEELLAWKQSELKELGWYVGEVDGIKGPLTIRAIEGAIESTDGIENREDLIEALYLNEVPDAPRDSTHGIAEHWLRLAMCESGNWVNGGESFTGPIRWNWGAPGMQLPPWGTNLHHGGLQFAPSTWSWVAPMVGLGHIRYAYEATPQEQVRVAERVQQLQGWQSWPVCSRLVGLR